jgi:hypothetical protein
MRNHLVEMPHDLDVLPAGVEDLQNLLVRQQGKQRLEVDAGGEGVNGIGLLVVRKLDETELRPEGCLAQELGVDGDESGFGEAGTGGLQVRGGGNQHEVRNT